MKVKMESIYSNHVYELIEPPVIVKHKWVYKRKRGPDGLVKTFKARLVAKWFNQKERINYEETFLPVAMLNSIRVLLSIAPHFNYEICQMDIKTIFLNDNLEEDIYMMQLDGFIAKGQEHMICKLHRSIYGLKQASWSWNIRFDQVIKSFDFEQNTNELCVYKKCERSIARFLILYVDDILLIGMI